MNGTSIDVGQDGTVQIDHVGDLHLHFHFGDVEASAKLDKVLINQAVSAEKFMATMQQVQDDLNQIKAQAGTYIAGRDAIDVQLRADLAAALAQAGVSTAEQAAIDAAFTTAEEAKALLTPPVTPPPGGGTGATGATGATGGTGATGATGVGGV